MGRKRIHICSSTATLRHHNEVHTQRYSMPIHSISPVPVVADVARRVPRPPPRHIPHPHLAVPSSRQQKTPIRRPRKPVHRLRVAHEPRGLIYAVSPIHSPRPHLASSRHLRRRRVAPNGQRFHRPADATVSHSSGRASIVLLRGVSATPSLLDYRCIVIVTIIICTFSSLVCRSRVRRVRGRAPGANNAVGESRSHLATGGLHKMEGGGKGGAGGENSRLACLSRYLGTEPSSDRRLTNRCIRFSVRKAGHTSSPPEKKTNNTHTHTHTSSVSVPGWAPPDCCLIVIQKQTATMILYAVYTRAFVHRTF